jgi:uncharacterized delta-60 repeat protein
LFFISMSLSTIGRAAPGEIDPSFSSGMGAVWINRVERLAAGKLMISGTFGSYNGEPRKCLARVNFDGSLDQTFDAGSGPNSVGIEDFEVQADGKVLVSGFFTTFSGQARVLVARLDSNGAVDPGFDPHTEAPSDAPAEVSRIKIQSDGKVLLVGRFKIRGESTIRSMARLNPDGSVDSSFDAGLTGSYFEDLATQADGKIVVSGYLQIPGPGDFLPVVAALSGRNNRSNVSPSGIWKPVRADDCPAGRADFDG